MSAKNRLINALLWIALLLTAAIGGAFLLIPGNTGISIPWGQLFGAQVNQATTLRRLHLNDEFEYSIFASNLANPRLLRPTRSGDLLVSEPNQGHILLLRADRDHNGEHDQQTVLIKGLTRPHGLDFFQDWLYIAESNAIGRIRFNHTLGRTEGQYQRVITGLGDSSFHWSKTLRLGPDGWFYLSSGSTCNACEEQDRQRATLMRFLPGHHQLEIFARGLRNSVGFDWSPFDGQLYATENGRDWLGDDFPPCELNRIVKGGFYGWPYANGNNIPDPDFGAGKAQEIAAATPPAHSFNAHTAPLGITFFHADNTPKHYRRTALVAQHGSWNRSTKAGYKVVALDWDSSGKIHERDFFWGFEKGGEIIGRPVDVVQATDGSIYISDDYSGKIYRIRYSGNL